MNNQNRMILFCIVIVNSVYSMESPSSVPTLFDLSANVVVKEIKEKQEHLTARNVLNHYQELYSNYFECLPLEVGQRVKDYVGQKSGWFHEPYTVSTTPIKRRSDDSEEIYLKGLSADAIACQGSLCTIATEAAIYCFDLANGEHRKVYEKCDEDRIKSIALSPLGNVLAAGFRIGQINIWNFGQELINVNEINCSENVSGDFLPHTGDITALAFSPRGTILASGSEDTSICLWDVSSRKGFENLMWHEALIRKICFYDDEKIASYSADGIIHIGNAVTKEILFTLSGKAFYEAAICFCLSPHSLVYSSNNGAIKQFDLIAEKQLGDGRNFEEVAVAYDLSPDGKLLAVSLWNNSIQLWGMETGELQKTLEIETLSLGVGDPPHHLGNELVAFSGDGKYLISADEIVRFWKRDKLEKMWLKIAIAHSLSSGDKEGLENLLQAIKTEEHRENREQPVSPLLKSLDTSFLAFMRKYITAKLAIA